MKQRMKKVVFSFPLVLVMIICPITPFSSLSFAKSSFPDAQGHWAANYINWGVENEILNGEEDGNFHPDDNVRQNEFLAMLVRAFSKSNPIVADEVYVTSPIDGEWDGKIMAYSKSKNWDLDADRNKVIDRGRVASILVSAMGLNCAEEESIQMLLNGGLSNGKDSATVDGYVKRDNLTRAEAVKFIQVFNFNKNIPDLKVRPTTHSEGCPIPNGQIKPPVVVAGEATNYQEILGKVTVLANKYGYKVGETPEHTGFAVYGDNKVKARITPVSGGSTLPYATASTFVTDDPSVRKFMIELINSLGVTTPADFDTTIVNTAKEGTGEFHTLISNGNTMYYDGSKYGAYHFALSIYKN